jgi:N-acetylmuramate 1-kinase
MPDRDAQIAAFAARAGWGAAERRALAGDASNRRYLRLHLGRNTAVLMDAPPERGEDVRPFLAIARHLSGLGLSAPAILAADEENGLLLLEDLGDGLLARLAAAEPAREAPLYAAAAETLAALHRAPPPQGLTRFTPDVMADLARLAFDWYAPRTPDADAAELTRDCATRSPARRPNPRSCRCATSMPRTSSGCRTAPGRRGWGFSTFRTRSWRIPPTTSSRSSRTRDAT